MRFELEIGRDAEPLTKQMERAGVQVSGPLANRPKLDFEHTFLYSSFWRLNSDRVWLPTFSAIVPSDLGWTAVQNYADRQEMRDSEREEFFEIIRAMDKVFIEHKTAEINRNARNATRSGKSGK